MTELDRWWSACLLFGLAFVVRAPTYLAALAVFVVWVLLLAMFSVRALSQFVDHAINTARVHPKKAATPTAAKAPQWDMFRTGAAPTSMASGLSPDAPTLADIPRVLADAPLVVAPTVADPAPTVRFTSNPPPRTVARDPMESVIRVQLSGTLWTTEELLVEMQAAVARVKHRGDGEAGGAPVSSG